VLVLVIVALPLLRPFSHDELYYEMVKLAGPNAINCGPYDEDSKHAVHVRAAQAYQAGKPFFYRGKKTSGGKTAGTVWNSKGQMFFLIAQGRSPDNPQGKIIYAKLLADSKLQVSPDGSLDIEYGNPINSPVL